MTYTYHTHEHLDLLLCDLILQEERLEDREDMVSSNMLIE